MPEIIIKVVEVIGITSVLGLIGLYLTFIGTVPSIVIEGTVEKSKRFNSESKLLIRNNGRLTAFNVRADVHNLSFEVNTNTFENCTFINCGPPLASRLSSGETTEITIRPGVDIGGGAHFDKYSYVLELIYQANLLFFRKTFTRRWMIKLKNYPDGYSWDVSDVVPA